jgi:putative nitrogen regulatory protein P-II
MRHLILAICNSGNADDVMNTAKLAGARGGTIIHARGSAQKDSEHFLGITIQPEKDVIMIIVDEETKNPIMQAISKNHGVGTKSHTITISLPVDDVVGITV